MNAEARPRIALLHLGRMHDETPALRAFLEHRGIVSELVSLPAPAAQEASTEWGRFDRVCVRDCRDSHRCGDFLERITALARRLDALAVPLVNPLPVILAGHAKANYLPQLEREGIPLIPSRWLPRGWRGSLAALLEESGWDAAVLKPAIGSRSWHTYRVCRAGGGLELTGADGTVLEGSAAGDRLLTRLARDGPVCMQLFLPAIHAEGEIGAVFLGGRFSHAVVKTVADGGWIAHERFGGRNRLHRASAEERGWAEAVYQRLGRRFGVLPYARIDGIRDGHGELRLLECELVVPRLFLTEADAFGRYADAVMDLPGRDRGRRCRS